MGAVVGVRVGVGEEVRLTSVGYLLHSGNFRVAALREPGARSYPDPIQKLPHY